MANKAVNFVKKVVEDNKGLDKVKCHQAVAAAIREKFSCGHIPPEYKKAIDDVIYR